MRLRKNSARPNKRVPLRATLVAALVAGSCWLSPAAAGDLAFVTSQNGNMVPIIDLSDNGIIAQTALQDAPAPVAYDPRAGRAYVIAADSGRLSVIDEAGRITATRDLGEGAFGIATAPDGGLFVTDWFEAKLTRLSRDLTTLWRVDTGNAPAGVAVSAAILSQPRIVTITRSVSSMPRPGVCCERSTPQARTPLPSHFMMVACGPRMCRATWCRSWTRSRAS